MGKDQERRLEQSVSEHDLRRVLKRAIELDDARSNEVTLDELQRLSQELNISPDSLAQALAELRSEPGEAQSSTAAQPRNDRRPGRWIVIGLIAAAGAGYLLNRSLHSPEFGYWLAAGPFLLALLAVPVLNRSSWPFHRFRA